MSSYTPKEEVSRLGLELLGLPTAERMAELYRLRRERPEIYEAVALELVERELLLYKSQQRESDQPPRVYDPDTLFWKFGLTATLLGQVVILDLITAPQQSTLARGTMPWAVSLAAVAFLLAGGFLVGHWWCLVSTTLRLQRLWRRRKSKER